jgi:hypothetical protein
MIVTQAKIEPLRTIHRLEAVEKKCKGTQVAEEAAQLLKLYFRMPRTCNRGNWLRLAQAGALVPLNAAELKRLEQIAAEAEPIFA